MKKLIVLQTATPDYRKGFFAQLASQLGSRFLLYRGSRYFEKSVVSDTTIPARTVQNHFFLWRKFLVQTGIFHLFVSRAIVVIEMNPRILTHWPLLVFRRFMGRKTVLWGHAWPRAGQGSKSDTIRGVMRALGTSIITYTRQQATELKGAMPKKTITAAPNALFSREQMQSGTSPMQPKNLIYVGRLTEAKKPMFLLRAFAKSLGDIPKGTQLVFVGEGPEMKKLQGFIEQNDLSARVKLKGHISAHKKLGQLYSESLLSVSPGYVGLSVTQSFGFGVPMLVSKTENHSPEIEAVREGENALFFETGSIEDFKEKLLQFYNNKPYWVSQRGQIVAFCKENYSVEAMAKVFANLM